MAEESKGTEAAEILTLADAVEALLEIPEGFSPASTRPKLSLKSYVNKVAA